MKPCENLADRLSVLRSRYGLTQAQLAEYLGMDQSMLSKIESGDRSIGLSLLEKLADLYCISAYDLMYAEELPNSPELAFRAKALSTEDFLVLSKINRIIINQQFMDKLKKENLECHDGI